MRAAWRQVQNNFAVANNALNPDPNTIASLEDELQRRGLTGPQLIFKLNVFRHALENLLDHGTAKYGQEQRKKPRWWARFLGFFTGALKAADVILDSLAKVPVVGLAVEPIKEFKEAQERQPLAASPSSAPDSTGPSEAAHSGGDTANRGAPATICSILSRSWPLIFIVFGP